MKASITLFNKNLPPLADRVRPQSMDSFVGQVHLTDEGRILSTLMKTGNLFSIILWGPPGTGKTTLARILAKQSQAELHEISAVSSGVKELRSIILKSRSNQELGRRTILFIDEIHRFSKSQQDALLHAVEDGLLILIGATTENPSFEVISPLLSRCRVLTLKPLTQEQLGEILDLSFQNDVILSKAAVKLGEEVRDQLIASCGGDARKMLNSLEVALSLTPEKGLITENILKEALQSKTQIYDKTGDYHYDTISAFIKSVRGSDPDAALYWLAVMLEGGEKPEFICRRLIILAAEDIGNADPRALIMATSAFQAVHMIGMPEGSIILSQITLYLAAAPKSNAGYMAGKKARSFVNQNDSQPVPLELRNAVTGLMKALDYGKDYDYPHDHPEHFIEKNYFPENVMETFYDPTGLGYEKFIKNRLKKLWPNRYGK